MVSRTERVAWLAGLGIVYTVGLVKSIQSINSISNSSFLVAKQRAESFFKNHNHKNVSWMSLDSHKKVVVLVGLEDNYKSTLDISKSLKQIFFELNPSLIILESKLD